MGVMLLANTGSTNSLPADPRNAAQGYIPEGTNLKKPGNFLNLGPETRFSCNSATAFGGFAIVETTDAGGATQCGQPNLIQITCWNGPKPGMSTRVGAAPCTTSVAACGAMVRVRLDRRVAARVDPSDVVQESLLEAYRRLPRVSPRSADPLLSAWLRQLAWERLVRPAPATHGGQAALRGPRSRLRSPLLSDDSIARGSPAGCAAPATGPARG